MGSDPTCKPKLLIIEPDLETRQAMESFLSKSFELAALGKGTDGLRLMEDAPVDVAILDLSLPDRLGISVLAEFRNRWPKCPLVCTYECGDRHQRLLPMVRQVVDFLLVKPVDLERLEEALLHLVQRRAAHPDSVSDEPEGDES